MKMIVKVIVLTIAFVMVAQFALMGNLKADEEDKISDSDKKELLLTSILADDIVTVRNILAKNSLDMETKSEGLIYATAMGNKEIVSLMLSFGVDVNQHAYDGDFPTALVHATMLGHSDIVKALIAAKANVNEKGDNFDTPLILASSYGNIFSTDKNSYPNIVKMLLRAKADPNVASIRNLTPLILATMAKNKEVVSALLAAGAKVNTKSDEGITACQYAIESGNLEIVKTLKNAGADCKKTIPDILAKRLTKAEATKQLMEIAKDSYTNVSYDNSHDMYNPSNSKKIKYLLGFGADINIQDDEGYTPLMRILEKEVPDFGIAKMLVNQDADVNLKNNKGETALHIFAQNGIFFSPTLLKKLIRAGTDINTRDDKGKTPLIHLMSKFSPPAECFFIFSVSLSNTSTEILLSSGADVNAKDKDGNTALSCLLQKNNYSGYNNECVALVKTLLKFSADPFIKNNNKKAPIDYVTTDTDPYIIKLLSEKTGLLLPLKN